MNLLSCPLATDPSGGTGPSSPDQTPADPDAERRLRGRVETE